MSTGIVECGRCGTRRLADKPFCGRCGYGTALLLSLPANVRRIDQTRITVNKQTHTFRIEDETEDSVTIIIEPKEAWANRDIDVESIAKVIP